MDSDAYWQFLVGAGPQSADDAVRLAAETHAERLSRDANIASQIDTRWADGWKYFDAVIFALEQDGLHMLRRADETDDGHAPVRLALVLLHSAATTIVHEIDTLLRRGYWAGAAARWRGLHELTVSTTLVARGGVEIATRYLDHGFVVQTKRAAEFYANHGRGPIPPDELARRQIRAQELIDKHTLPDQTGKFNAAYGWAIPLLPRSKSGKLAVPTFEALERLAEADHLRLLVFSAHGHVHGDSAGVQAVVLMEEQAYAMSAMDRFTEVVARPTLLSVAHLVAASHLGFEPELNQFAKLLGLLGSAICHNAQRGATAFGEST